MTQKDIPPPIPRQKNWRWAATLNLILPGAGLFYMGRRKSGAVLAIAFLVCLAAALGIFLLGYARYLTVILSGDLMRDGQLERLKDVFHSRWLVGLFILGLALQVVSIAALSLAREEEKEKA